eukprot:m.180433 g.180433  ORF g.180433 m.180433 type:complete len:783 (+) comp16854_c1_seq9:1197-3545(+)
MAGSEASALFKVICLLMLGSSICLDAPCSRAGLNVLENTNHNCSDTTSTINVAHGAYCNVSCVQNSHAYDTYRCQDGRWYADLERGNLCPLYADCKLNETAFICDRCGREASTTAIPKTPERCSAGLQLLRFRCHDIGIISSECLFHIGVSLTVLDVSNNRIRDFYRSSFSASARLETFNLSNNRLTDIGEAFFPRSVSLRTLDISQNNMVTVDPLSFVALFTTDCSVDVELVQDGNPCQCNLFDRGAMCHGVLCDCEERQRISCDFVNGSADAPSIFADQLCDGVADCPGCVDERACNIAADLQISELSNCVGERLQLRIVRGVGGVGPEDEDYRQLGCVFLPFGQYISLPIVPIISFVPVSWSIGSGVGNVDSIVTSYFADNNTFQQRMLLIFETGQKSENLFQNYTLPTDCPVASTAPTPAVTITKKSNLPLILAVVCGAVLLVALVACVGARRMRRRVAVVKRAKSKRNQELQQTIDRLLLEFKQGMATDGPSHLPVYYREVFSENDEDGLGEGNFGTVHKLAVVKANKELRIGMEVACKSFPAVKSNSSIKDIILEACMLYSLKHPHIVPLLGLINDTLPLSLVMELAPMGSLKPYLRACGAETAMDDKVAMMAQCASALAFVHSNQIVHRDLAARNVLLYSTLPILVKLGDFGLGRRLSSTQDYYKSSSLENMPFRYTIPLTGVVPCQPWDTVCLGGWHLSLLAMASLLWPATCGPLASSCGRSSRMPRPHTKAWHFSRSVSTTVKVSGLMCQKIHRMRLQGCSSRVGNQTIVLDL